VRRLRSLHVSDSHGEFQDDKAIETVLRFRKEWKPDIVIHHGDAFDFPWLMRRASDDDKNHSITVDMEKGEAFLRQVKPTHYMLGNHEARLWKTYKSANAGSWKHTLLSSLIERIRDAAGDAKIYEYHVNRVILKLGQYHLMHGWRSGVYALRTMVKDIGASLMVGHNHAADDIEVDILSRPRGISLGCLCNTSMDYADTHAISFRQNHAFAYGEKRADGTWDMTLKRLNAPTARVEVIG